MRKKRRKAVKGKFFPQATRRKILVLDLFKIVIPDNSTHEWEEFPNLLGWIITVEGKTEYWISIHSDDYPDLITGLKALGNTKMIEFEREN